MLGHLEAMLCCHRVLYCFEFSGKKLDDAATFRADHVIVMLMFVVVLVVGDAVAKANFTRQPGFSQKLQSPVDSGLSNTGIVLLDQAVKVFAGKVVLGAQEGIEDQSALGSAFEPAFLDVLEKHFLLFGIGLLRRH